MDNWDQPNDLWRVAYHEAGHGVAAYLLGFQSVSVDLTRNGTSAGDIWGQQPF